MLQSACQIFISKLCCHPNPTIQNTSTRRHSLNENETVLTFLITFLRIHPSLLLDWKQDDILPIRLNFLANPLSGMSFRKPIKVHLITKPLMRFLRNEPCNLLNSVLPSSTCSECMSSPLSIHKVMRGQRPVDSTLLSLGHARSLGEEKFEAVLQCAHVGVRVTLQFKGIGDDFDGPGCYLC
jgi:hypothetical protein